MKSRKYVVGAGHGLERLWILFLHSFGCRLDIGGLEKEGRKFEDENPVVGR